MSKTGNRNQTNPKRPKKLGFPDLDHSRSAVLESLRPPESKRGYRHALDEFIEWCSGRGSRSCPLALWSKEYTRNMTSLRIANER